MKKSLSSRRTPSRPSTQQLFVRMLRQHGILLTEQLTAEFIKWFLQNQVKQFLKERMDIFVVEQGRLNNLPLVFPNGKQGEEYSKEVALPADTYDCVWFEGLEPVGLEYDAEAGILHGVPETPGDYDFTLCAQVKGWQEGEPVLKRQFHIGINADPKSLWKDLPVPDDILYPNRDTDLATIEAYDHERQPLKTVIAASKRGRSHAQEAKPRDDDFAASFNEANEWYVMAVADGAGSAQYSREGSRVACETVEKFCTEKLAELAPDFDAAIIKYAETRSNEDAHPVVTMVHSILVKAAVAAHEAIKAKADNCATAVMKDFSTTLLLTICRRFEFGWFIASFGVGDGAIAIYDESADAVKLLNEPDGGEFAGQTRFLTMESIFRDRNRLRMSIVPDFTALLMMTDGISDPFFETDANLQRKEKWDALWADLNASVDFGSTEADEQLLAWLDFWSPGNHDDRTIAILS